MLFNATIKGKKPNHKNLCIYNIVKLNLSQKL